MCTVQVLLVPDVMRRTNGPVRADPPRNICRRLFSHDDRPPLASNSQFLNHLRKDLEKRDRERWNFDFRTEMPLPGRYNWVPVGPKAQTELSKDSVIKTEASSSTAIKDDRPSPSLRRTSKISNIKKKGALQSKITGKTRFLLLSIYFPFFFFFL